MPQIPFRILLLISLLAMLIVGIQVGVLTIAFEKLDLTEGSALLLLITIMAGSMINLPLFSMKSERPNLDEMPPQLRELYRDIPYTGRTLVMVNVGGCVAPSAFCFYLMAHHPMNLFNVAAAVSAVALLSYKMSRSIPGVGLGMPMFFAPLLAALLSVFLDPQNAAPMAFISGTLGVLIGADLMHFPEIRKMGTPSASIGGAGSFDGIFISGIVAVLLT